MYAEVGVNTPVKGTFHYHIPPELEGKIVPGHLARVSFRTSMLPAIVLALHRESPVQETKPIIELLDPFPVMTPRHIALALWMAERYLAPVGICLWLMLPPGITGKNDKLVRLAHHDNASDDPLEQRVLELLKQQGPMRLSQIRKLLKHQETKQAILHMREAGLVTLESVLSPPLIKPKFIKMISLAIPPERISSVARRLGKRSQPADLLEVIAANPENPIAEEDALRIAEAKPTALSRLEKEGYIYIEKIARGKSNWIHLSISPESVDEALTILRDGYRQRSVLEYLGSVRQPVPEKRLREQFKISAKQLEELAEAGLVTIGQHRLIRDSLADRDFVPAIAPPLTPEQQSVWEVIEKRLEGCAGDEPESGQSAGSAFLLHGVTGSGKTEIYLRAIAHCLAQGRQAIFLVPEIALTAQTIKRVAERFPGQAAIAHGSLSPRERLDTWHRARAGEIGVVVGTRSALFTPSPDIGLIILDEEHDNSYKQSPLFGLPYYNARDVAGQMTKLNNGVLILGSATPDIESMYRAEKGEFALLKLPDRIMGHRVRVLEQAERTGVAARYYPFSKDAVTIDLPPVHVVDMRYELKSGNTDMFSRDLKRGLADTLERGEQAILFLNRRGQSTYVFCRDCGTAVTCPRCDTAMTYHHYGTQMQCHHCGHVAPQPDVCSVCNSRRIRYFGAGTQQVEKELRRHFPQAKYLRWDADSAGKPETHEAILRQFLNHEADVMIGTQMIAKGLDLPLVTLVGVVSADPGLALPDFRAGERAFQLLTQVSGRAGRGILGGQVILQTYQPDHYAIRAAAYHDYEGFYKREIAYRHEIGYPPFRRLARILFRYTNPQSAQREAQNVAIILRERMDQLRLTGTELIGPVPCFFQKIDKHYRWHVLLRGPDPTIALRDLEIRPGWHLDIDPVDIL